MEIKVSVIIPVYNKEKYISSCINSILEGNTTCSTEIIAVDDGSTDKSREVIKDICRHYSEVTLICKENGGSSSARNLGITHAKGEYMLFIDADDYLKKGSIEKLVAIMEDNNADVVVFDIIKDYKKKSEVWHDFTHDESTIYSGKDYIDKFILDMCIPSACNKLWKKSLFIDNNILFPEDIDFGEDGATVLRIMASVQRIIKLNEGLYHYKIHEESKIFNNDSKVYEYITSYNLVLNYLKDKNYYMTHAQKFNYKYTYAYKILEDVTFFDKRMKNQSYKKMYYEFISDVKNIKGNLMSSDDLYFNKKAYFRSNIIVKSYRVNKIFGEMSKIAFKFIKTVLSFMQIIKK